MLEGCIGLCKCRCYLRWVPDISRSIVCNDFMKYIPYIILTCEILGALHDIFLLKFKSWRMFYVCGCCDVNRTATMPVIWDAMTLKWRQLDDHQLSWDYIFEYQMGSHNLLRPNDVHLHQYMIRSSNDNSSSYVMCPAITWTSADNQQRFLSRKYANRCHSYSAFNMLRV